MLSIVIIHHKQVSPTVLVTAENIRSQVFVTDYNEMHPSCSQQEIPVSLHFNQTLALIISVAGMHCYIQTHCCQRETVCATQDALQLHAEEMRRCLKHKSNRI